MGIYFENIIVILVPLWFCFFLILKIKYKKTYIYLFFFTIFYIYLSYVIKYTQFPIHLDIGEYMSQNYGQNVWREANFIPFKTITDAIQDARVIPFKSVFDTLRAALLNVLLTMPFGFGLPFIIKVNFKKIALFGAILGVILELLQLIVALLVGYTFRYVNIDDVICNFIGVVIGYGIFKLFIMFYKYIIHKFDIKLNSLLKYIYETDI